MKQYSDQELEEKIQSFLASKRQKYPELVTPQWAPKTLSIPKFSGRLLRSLVSYKPLAMN